MNGGVSRSCSGANSRGQAGGWRSKEEMEKRREGKRKFLQRGAGEIKVGKGQAEVGQRREEEKEEVEGNTLYRVGGHSHNM